LTPEQVAAVEAIVNAQIARDLPVTVAVMSLDEAVALGALAFFGEKYGEQVKVYTVGDAAGDVFSREVCGGPHVSRTGEMGRFQITKQESVGQGVRRLRAVLASAEG
jgi:alanyl-tRNA synthetase